jgi:hypothetical protein
MGGKYQPMRDVLRHPAMVGPAEKRRKSVEDRDKWKGVINHNHVYTDVEWR